VELQGAVWPVEPVAAVVFEVEPVPAVAVVIVEAEAERVVVAEVVPVSQRTKSTWHSAGHKLQMEVVLQFL